MTHYVTKVHWQGRNDDTANTVGKAEEVMIVRVPDPICVRAAWSSSGNYAWQHHSGDSPDDPSACQLILAVSWELQDHAIHVADQVLSMRSDLMNVSYNIRV